MGAGTVRASSAHVRPRAVTRGAGRAGRVPGTTATAAGLVTPGELRGARFLRMFPDTYVRRRPEPPDLALRSRAAGLYVAGRGVLSGYSAAELLEASCGPRDSPAEVTVPAGVQRTHPGLPVHRDIPRPRRDPTTRSPRPPPRRAPPTTSPADSPRTTGSRRWSPSMRSPGSAAFRPPRSSGFRSGTHGPAAARTLRRRRPAGGCPAGSPMETRLRLVLVLRGLPRPEAQYAVLDDRRRRAVWLDLAYPAHRIGIEYEGADHTARGGCCVTPAGTRGWSTRGGGCTASRSTRSTASPTRSPRPSAGAGRARAEQSADRHGDGALTSITSRVEPASERQHRDDLVHDAVDPGAVRGEVRRAAAVSVGVVGRVGPVGDDRRRPTAPGCRPRPRSAPSRSLSRTRRWPRPCPWIRRRRPLSSPG